MMQREKINHREVKKGEKAAIRKYKETWELKEIIKNKTI